MSLRSEEFSPLSNGEVRDTLDLFELSPTKKVSFGTLRTMLPTIETTLFFAKVYKLNYAKLSELIRRLHRTSVVQALLSEGGAHSSQLQDYIVETVPEIGSIAGSLTFGATPEGLHPELLAKMWEQAEVEIADSIASVADKLSGVLDRLPSKYGTMTFETLRKMNLQRPTMGVHSAVIRHERVSPRLVVLDVSGSMTESTIRRIVDEVVALAYKSNASLAIVSNTATWWDAGTFNSDDVLRTAEFSGTHYEKLKSVFDEDWETVITIADYDSSPSAKTALAGCRGRIEQVLDISLVGRPTYLAECVGQLAAKVKPILVGNSQYVLS